MLSELISTLGYAHNSPFRNAAYLDINTPEGIITMEDTPIDLLGIDNHGTVKKMKAGSKTPYRFSGNVVREIPLKMGGNPYQNGGITNQQLFDYLFADDDEETPIQAEPEQFEDDSKDLSLAKNEKLLRQREADDLAMQQAMMSYDNPYRRDIPMEWDDEELDLPYTQQLSSGKWGDKNIGQYGKRIIQDITQALGYTPTFNSIFRDRRQQDALMAAGKPAAKNSWHLSGNAVDMKPADWNNLPSEKKAYFRANYDVIYHDNHYHIEPK